MDRAAFRLLHGYTGSDDNNVLVGLSQSFQPAVAIAAAAFVLAFALVVSRRARLTASGTALLEILQLM